MVTNCAGCGKTIMMALGDNAPDPPADDCWCSDCFPAELERRCALGNKQALHIKKIRENR